MKQGIKLVGLLAAGALALSACGTTASTPTSSAPADGSEAPSSQAIETVAFEPGEVVKPADGEVIKIGVTFPILDQFLQTVADGIEARAKEAGVEVTIVAAQEKADVQLGQVENFISQGLDGIIIIPVDTDAAGPMTEKAQDAEIPLVYVNRRPSDLPAGVPYVGSDSLVAGQLQMKALAELADGKGKVGILIGDPANEAARLRTEGCKQILEEYPDRKLIREQAGNWYREKGLAITEN